MCDEYAQIKKEILDLVVNPMMNVKRGYSVGKTDYDDDVGNRLLITSSAYFRHNHLFPTFKQYVDEVASGNDKYFLAVLPYTVGIRVGLFDDDHIEKEKKRLSNADFRMEYECIFPNMSENAWIEPEDLEACSTLKLIETIGNKKYEYIMGLDVARVEGGDNTICHVVKLVKRKTELEKHLVYTLSMNGEKFETQAYQIRQLLKAFPSTIRIYMDTQTIGQGLADELSKDYYDIEEGKTYPPLIDANDEQAVRNIPHGIKLIYGITPSAENNHRMGMSVKKNTQKRLLKMYSRDAGETDIKKNDEIQTVLEELTLEQEKQVLEAEATRREVMNIEAKPQGMFFKFQSASKRGRKDRWSALGLSLYGSEILEQERLEDDEEVLVGSIRRR